MMPTPPRARQRPPLQSPDWATVISPESAAASTPTYCIRVLFLLPEFDLFQAAIEDEFCQEENRELRGGKCVFQLIKITSDAQISLAITHFDPSVVVTVGTPWMQWLLSGLCEERRITSKELQDVERLHGSMIPVELGSTRRLLLFPLIGYKTTGSSPRVQLKQHQRISDPGGSPPPHQSTCRRVLFQDDAPPEISSSVCLDDSTAHDLRTLMSALRGEIDASSPAAGSPSQSTFYDMVNHHGNRHARFDMDSAFAVLRGRSQSPVHE